MCLDLFFFFTYVMLFVCMCVCRDFFSKASTVETAEERFGIDEYSDVIMLTKPVIYISVKEVVSTHSVSNKKKELFKYMLMCLNRHPPLSTMCIFKHNTHTLTHTYTHTHTALA